MIGAAIEAYECTQDEEWVQLAATCFNWYLGENDQQIKLYDHSTGGCRDGLTRDGVNFNQGAESTLAYLCSLIAIYNVRGLTGKTTSQEPHEPEQDLAGDLLRSADSF